ncbi:hypothetical protein, partial [Bacteroides acidifaciens]|uniref:hypothetical protein n=1 Tax=Bacteroides acidifaciens TaxID=85831 RepID=UPI0025B53863
GLRPKQEPMRFRIRDNAAACRLIIGRATPKKAALRLLGSIIPRIFSRKPGQTAKSGSKL